MLTPPPRMAARNQSRRKRKNRLRKNPKRNLKRNPNLKRIRKKRLSRLPLLPPQRKLRLLTRIASRSARWHGVFPKRKALTCPLSKDLAPAAELLKPILMQPKVEPLRRKAERRHL